MDSVVIWVYGIKGGTHTCPIEAYSVMATCNNCIFFNYLLKDTVAMMRYSSLSHIFGAVNRRISNFLYWIKEIMIIV